MPRRTKSAELIEFEIRFYEKLVTAYPDFVDALVPLGHAYTRLGHYDKGLQIDQRLTQLRESDSVIWYNLACSYSLLKRLEESATSPRRSIELGYRDFQHLQNDPDLLNLRRSPQYQELLSSFVSLAAMKHQRTPSTDDPAASDSSPLNL